jgi:hypothetical protein
MGQKRTRDSLQRRKPRLSPRARILIVCEGQVTEPIYFKDLGRQARVRLIEVVVNEEGGVPKTIVERAVQLKKSARRTAKRLLDDFLDFDEVWCVFDVDEHPNLPHAIQQANANGVNLAISNPCFELWILLHFQDQRAHVDRARVQADCRRHIPNYRKTPPMLELNARYDQALTRAIALEKWQSEQGRFRENPSTEVHRLTEQIKKLGGTAAFQNVR